MGAPTTNAFPGLTQQETAEEVGLTLRRVQQIELLAIRKLWRQRTKRFLEGGDKRVDS